MTDTPEQRNGVEATETSQADAIAAPDLFKELTGGSTVPDLVKANVERTEADAAEAEGKSQEAENSSGPDKPDVKTEGEAGPDDDWGLAPEAEAKDEPAEKADKDIEDRLYAGEFKTPEELEQAYKDVTNAVGIQGEYLDELFTEAEDGRLVPKEAVQAILDGKEKAPEIPDSEELTALRGKLDDQFGDGSAETILQMMKVIGGTEKKADQVKADSEAREDRLNHDLRAKVADFKAKRSEKTFEKYQDQISDFYDRMPPDLARDLIVNDWLPMDDVFLLIKGKAELPALLQKVRDAGRQEVIDRSVPTRMEPSQTGISEGASQPEDYASQIAGAGRNTDFDKWLHGT